MECLSWFLNKCALFSLLYIKCMSNNNNINNESILQAWHCPKRLEWISSSDQWRRTSAQTKRNVQGPEEVLGLKRETLFVWLPEKPRRRHGPRDFLVGRSRALFSCWPASLPRPRDCAEWESNERTEAGANQEFMEDFIAMSNWELFFNHLWKT